MAGAISPGEVKRILFDLGFQDSTITPNERSVGIIRGWNLGEGAEKVALSAYIQAVNPI